MWAYMSLVIFYYILVHIYVHLSVANLSTICLVTQQTIMRLLTQAPYIQSAVYYGNRMRHCLQQDEQLRTAAVALKYRIFRAAEKVRFKLLVSRRRSTSSSDCCPSTTL